MATNLHGQRLVIHILGEVVKQACGCSLIYANEVEPTDKYPFVTFNVIIPEQETTSDWLGDRRQFTCHLQIDVHTGNFYHSLDLANKLYEALKGRTYERFFTQCRINVQEITNVSDRTFLGSVNYDYDLGFDCLFLVSSEKDYDIDSLNFTPDQETTIKTASAANVLSGEKINTEKNYKEEKN